MNGKSEDTLAVDGALFDLLVDGELDSARRHELLLRIDALPGGWRRCALAFLEAQAWRSDLRTAADAPAAANSRSAVAVAPSRSQGGRARRWGVLALGLLVAFGAGWLTRPTGEGLNGSGGGAGAVIPPARVALRESMSNEQSDSTAPEPDENTSHFAASMRMAGFLTLQVDDHGQTREVQVPVLEAPGIDVRRLLEQAPAVRSAAVQALERRGHKVETHRQLLTVDLKDGRKLLLPIDQVDVHFANRVYQ